VLDRVRDGDPPAGEQGESLRLTEARLVGPAVREPALTGAEVPAHPLAVRVQLDQAVAGGVGDKKTPVGKQERLPREAQMRGDRVRRDVGTVAAAQCALRRVLGLQLLDELLDGVGMALTRVLGDDIALRVDDDKRRPGPHGVLLPRGELGVVEDRVVHLVALYGIDDGLVLGLVHELRRVDTDDHHGVAVLLLQLAQLIEDMQTVHTAKGPKIQDHNASSQVSEGVLPVACIEPAALADQLRGADACTCSHDNSQHHRRLRAFRWVVREPVIHETSGA
jgi:hypothetical protein